MPCGPPTTNRIKKKKLEMKTVHTRMRITLLGRTKLAKLPEGFRVLLTNAGRPGDGGGEKRRWLKLKRDEVDDSGPRSWLYEAALRRFIRGGETIILECLVRERSSVGGMVDFGQ
jgi:hypothetical protein